MGKLKILPCPVCSQVNRIINPNEQLIGETYRVKCVECGCIYFADDDYKKPIYDYKYNMEFFRGTDIRKAGIVAYEVDKIMTKERKGCEVLEVGTGNGLFTFLMKSLGYDATALDLDEELTKFLREKMNINTMTGNFLTRAIKKKYALIYSSHVIEHIQDPIAFLHKANVCLKEKGLLYLDTPNGKFQEKYGNDWKHFRTRNIYEHCCILNPKAMEMLATKTNFRIEYCESNNTYESMQVILRKGNI